MIFAEVSPGAWAALSAAITVAGGVLVGILTLRGNARSTTVQVDANRNEANDETIKNLLADNQRLLSRVDRAEAETRLWMGRYHACMERAEEERHQRPR